MYSCSSNDSKESNNIVTVKDIKSFDTTISFSGYWLSETYFNSIKRNNSPRQAQDGSLFIFIPAKTLKTTMMIANFHEGGPLLTILKNIDKYQAWEIQDDSIIQAVFDIQVLSQDKIKIGDNSFVKISPIEKDGHRFILEDILFQGQYISTDNKTIEFTKNGQVKGLGNYEFYSPIIDYIDAGMQVDQIGLGTSENDLEYFGFKFKQDTLELYKLKCLTVDSTDNNRCVEVDFGQLLYKLCRKK